MAPVLAPLAAVLAGLALVGCGGSTAAHRLLASDANTAHWSAFKSVKGVVDLSAQRLDSSIVVAAAGRLRLLLPTRSLRPFAPGYAAPKGLEPYIALSTGRRLVGAHCRFPAGSVYALRLAHGDGVTVIGARGRVARFASLPPQGLEDGIAFDDTGRFGSRLLVTSTASGTTTVFAIDCRGHVQVLTRSAPRVEGGIAVAPRSFGRFGGDLIAPDELSGRVYAIAPNGHSSLVAQSGIPHGQDVGVESEGFVPARFNYALVADRLTPGNPHPGDDLILGIRNATLASVGVRAGDLLVVSEGGAQTVAITCGSACRVRKVATGPGRAHIEGHVTFTGAP